MSHPIAAEPALYGRGWQFPPSFSLADPQHPHQGGAAMVEEADSVKQSMRILFMTQPGERIMRADYGCDLQSAVFANLNEDLLAALRTRITDSVLRHERRARLIEVSLTPDPARAGYLAVEVVYQLAGQAQWRRLAGSLELAEGGGGSF